jgi:putative phosphoesterase
MKIGIISDTHDHKTHTKKAVQFFLQKSVDQVIHCGDFCSPFMMNLFKPLKMIAVFGNNDGDLFLLMKKAEEAGVELKGGFWETTLNDKKLAVYHGTHESITQALLYCGFYDVVITGHTHVIKNEYVGKTLHLNPGSANGFEETPTIMILDLEIVKVEVISLID